jgi:hypothetical protein
MAFKIVRVGAQRGLDFSGHQYFIGTTSLNGFDALPSAYACSRNGIQAQMLPVVTEFYGDTSNMRASLQVASIPSLGLIFLVEKNVVRAEKEVPWLEELSDILFYTWDIQPSSEVWEG